MNSPSFVSYICSNGPIDFELQDRGRILLIRDALYDPSTKKYHDIKLVKNGWKLLGFDLGGGGEFSGITEDVVRQIQSTYGIVLKTLNSKPNDAVFWGDQKKTSYITDQNAVEKYPSKWRMLGNVKTSYPLGKKQEDLLLSKEDSTRFGVDQMTLHDAIQKGIWNADSWIKEQARSFANDKASSEKETVSNAHGLDQKKLKGKSQEAASQNSLNALPKSTKKLRSSELDPASQTRLKRTRSSSAIEDQDVALDSNKSRKGSKRQRKSALADFNDGSIQSVRSSTDHKSRLGPVEEDEAGILIDTFPSIPVYRADSTPIAFGYDDAPFEERKKRIIAHLDSISPIPFSAFVDDNLEKRIHPLLFQRMVEALRRLTKNPEANDSDAKYMKELFKHWFRGAYHYLDRNSKPGDGYEQVFSKVSEEIKDQEKAEKKAKEIYWRRHATDFWMTLVDLFASEKIGIDLFHKSISNKTSLNPWF